MLFGRKREKTTLVIDKDVMHQWFDQSSQQQEPMDVVPVVQSMTLAEVLRSLGSSDLPEKWFPKSPPPVDTTEDTPDQAVPETHPSALSVDQAKPDCTPDEKGGWVLTDGMTSDKVVQEVKDAYELFQAGASMDELKGEGYCAFTIDKASGWFALLDTPTEEPAPASPAPAPAEQPAVIVTAPVAPPPQSVSVREPVGPPQSQPPTPPAEHAHTLPDTTAVTKPPATPRNTTGHSATTKVPRHRGAPRARHEGPTRGKVTLRAALAIFTFSAILMTPNAVKPGLDMLCEVREGNEVGVAVCIFVSDSIMTVEGIKKFSDAIHSVLEPAQPVQPVEEKKR